MNAQLLGIQLRKVANPTGGQRATTDSVRLVLKSFQSLAGILQGRKTGGLSQSTSLHSSKTQLVPRAFPSLSLSLASQIKFQLSWHNVTHSPKSPSVKSRCKDDIVVLGGEVERRVIRVLQTCTPVIHQLCLCHLVWNRCYAPTVATCTSYKPNTTLSNMSSTPSSKSYHFQNELHPFQYELHPLPIRVSHFQCELYPLPT